MELVPQTELVPRSASTGRLKQKKYLHIHLSSERHAYYPDDEVEGYVSIQTTHAMQLKRIWVEFVGMAHVGWEDEIATRRTEEGRKKREKIQHVGDETFFCQRESLWKVGANAEGEFFPLGNQKFKFRYRLPADLPSSFEGRYGCIRYYVKAHVEEGPVHVEHVSKRNFSVIGYVDLNSDSQALVPLDFEEYRTICCWCCKKGAVELKVHLDRRGFVPGEDVVPVVDINNGSTSPCSMDIQVIMTVKYKSSTQTQMERRTLLTSNHVTREGTSECWKDPLQIPPVPPSKLPGCLIIDVSYRLTFSLDPGGCNCDMVQFATELLIGTIPVRTSGLAPDLVAPQRNKVQLSPSTPRYPTRRDPVTCQPRAASPSAPPIDLYDIQPAVHPRTHRPSAPPTYAECIFKKGRRGEHDSSEGEGGFTPLYAFYSPAKSNR